MEQAYDYGMWVVVAINAALFIGFVSSYIAPMRRREWRSFGALTAFIIALFTEMYGFPLTIYVLSGWLGSRFPALTLTHSGGHLWNDLIGWTGDPHMSPFHFASYAFMLGGFWVIAKAWRVLWASARTGTLATTGPYARVRHPQYVGFLAVMSGFLLQWPTIPTLVMFPVLVAMYRRLALAEEREVRAQFGAAWDDYAAMTPRFIPRRGALDGSGGPTPRPRAGVGR